METKTKSATPALARVAGEDDPFAVLGALVPSGAPMRALMKIKDDQMKLVEALRYYINMPQMAEANARCVLRELGEEA